MPTLFLDVMQRWLVVGYQRSGMDYWSHLKNETDRFSHQPTMHNIPEEEGLSYTTTKL
jgi:hypothetical protein